jgi:hypothetical protein
MIDPWLIIFFAAHPKLFGLAIFLTSAVVGHRS